MHRSGFFLDPSYSVSIFFALLASYDISKASYTKIFLFVQASTAKHFKVFLCVRFVAYRGCYHKFDACVFCVDEVLIK